MLLQSIQEYVYSGAGGREWIVQTSRISVLMFVFVRSRTIYSLSLSVFWFVCHSGSSSVCNPLLCSCLTNAFHSFPIHQMRFVQASYLGSLVSNLCYFSSMLLYRRYFVLYHQEPRYPVAIYLWCSFRIKFIIWKFFFSFFSFSTLVLKT